MGARLLNHLRTLLVLGRVSNLPTVWSNCLAGWLLGGGGRWGDFAFVSLGGSLLYAAGMFLNDAFDADFDRQHRPDRPIPSGAIRAKTVWGWGLTLLGSGLACFAIPGNDSLLIALLLSLAILVYDAVHKMVAFSPILMAGCRLLLVIGAATPTYQGPTGLVLWSGLVLACYIVGVSCLARKEVWGGSLRYWPCAFLAAPMVLALIVNRGPWALRGALLTVLVGAWILLCLRHTYWSPQRNIGRSVSGLLAGIGLVDWLAVGGGGIGLNLLFAGLFGLTLLSQRFVPAT
jgi:4-hydroxybenzoate polyprenyltransferase